MGAYGDMEQAIAGLLYGLDYETETWKAGEQINWGDPVFGYEGDDVNCYTMKEDTETLTLDADLVASNVITTTVTIDGVAQTPVATTFATDHDTTMAAHAAALEAAISGLVATITDVATNARILELFYEGGNISATSVVTLGGSQAGITAAASTKQVFLGVAIFHQSGYVDSVGYYVQYDAVNVLVKGKCYVTTNAAVNANTDADVVKSGSDQGKFNPAGYDTNCKFRSTLAAAGIALVEVNGQNKE